MKLDRQRLILPEREDSKGMDTVQFGQAIRLARRRQGMTQRDLALVINTGERFIINLEAGKPTCQIGKALAAAQAVGWVLTPPEPPVS